MESDVEPVRAQQIGDARRPWELAAVNVRHGGPLVVDQAELPVGQLLPYRRAAGQSPAATGLAEQISERGWWLQLPAGSLGDLLLGLAVPAGLAAVAPAVPLHYRGPRPDLLARCTLSLATTTPASGPHRVWAGNSGIELTVVPERPPAWLDPLGDGRVAVHTDLPMRYYLELEQQLGLRLPADHAPAPRFRSPAAVVPGRVVFIATTSRPDRKHYGAPNFAALAAALTRYQPGATFVMLTAADTAVEPGPWQTITGRAAERCVDELAAAELVIGNDTGLTHLAALTDRDDGTSPQVIGLYARHAHGKWVTGRENHTAIATRFSAMLHAADRCPVRDQIDDTAWGSASDLTALPAEVVADIAARAAGWR